MLLQPITVPFSKSTLKPSVYTLTEFKFFYDASIDYVTDLLIFITLPCSRNIKLLLFFYWLTDS